MKSRKENQCVSTVCLLGDIDGHCVQSVPRLPPSLPMHLTDFELRRELELSAIHIEADSFTGIDSPAALVHGTLTCTSHDKFVDRIWGCPQTLQISWTKDSRYPSGTLDIIPYNK